VSESEVGGLTLPLASARALSGILMMDSFTKRQYAPVEIILTEMKGYGLRAGADIPS